jgi:hypothetical protein
MAARAPAKFFVLPGGECLALTPIGGMAASIEMLPANR